MLFVNDVFNFESNNKGTKKRSQNITLKMNLLFFKVNLFMNERLGQNNDTLLGVYKFVHYHT